MVSHRMERINSLIKEEISKILLYKIKHIELGHIAVTRVEVSKDLHFGKVYVSSYNDETGEEIMKTLKKVRPTVQHYLGKSIDLRFTPKIKFQFDEGVNKGFRVLKLIDEIKNEDDEGNIQDK